MASRRSATVDAGSGGITTHFTVPRETGELTGAALEPDGLLASTADEHLLHVNAVAMEIGPRTDALARAELLAADRGRALAAAGELIGAPPLVVRLFLARARGRP